jgi:hypothetical protein
VVVVVVVVLAALTVGRPHKVNNGQIIKIKTSIRSYWILACGQETVVSLVQFSTPISVPFCRTVTKYCGQFPDAFVRHHSPQDAHSQLLDTVELIVWHMIGTVSIAALNAL